MTKVTLANVGSLIDATTAATTINSNSAAVVAAFDNTLSRDGTAPNTMSAALDMNSNQIYNLPAPSTVNSPARLIDVVSNPSIVVPGTGTSGHTVPFLDGNNTFSGTNTFTSTVTLPANSVPNASLAVMAANTVKGSIAGGTPADLSKTQLTTLINPVTSVLSGAVPATGGGTTNFLRADATFANPNTMVLLNTLTASNSSSLTDSTSFTATYKSYQIIITNLVPAASNVTLSFLYVVAGSAQVSGYLAQEIHASGVGIATTAITTFLPLGPTATVTGGNPGLSGSWIISDVASTTTTKTMYGTYTCLVPGPAAMTGTTGGWFNTNNGAVTGFTVASSSGNLTSGTIKVYGIL